MTVKRTVDTSITYKLTIKEMLGNAWIDFTDTILRNIRFLLIG